MKKHLGAGLAFTAELLSVALFLVAVVGLAGGDWPMVPWGLAGSLAAASLLGRAARYLADGEAE